MSGKSLKVISDMHQFLFAFVSISLKTSLSKKVHLGEKLTVKCKMWDKIHNL